MYIPCDIRKAFNLMQSRLIQLTSKYIHNMAILCCTLWKCFIMLQVTWYRWISLNIKRRQSYRENALSTKSEIARKVLSFIHFTHGFRSLHGSELTYFWKLCQARRQQCTFFNQAWEIGPQAWDRSFQPTGVRVGRYI